LATKQLIIFVKAARPGAVKTRLASAIGPETACAAYRTLAEELFGRLESLSTVELRFSPDDAHQEIAGWQRRSWTTGPQGEGDLGRRLQRAFSDAFAQGAKYVAIIGSDCPAITAGDIQAAWTALQTNEIVIGPARDGGYWLVGLRELQPSLFEGIEWSTDKVLEQTLQCARQQNLRVALLRELRDVDTESDWLDYLKEKRRQD
jgi:rSAM/selenodomain-associated transferase 1